MRPVPDKWWQYIPERPWPRWFYVLDIVFIALMTVAYVEYGMVAGFLIVFLAVLLLLPVFFAWQWMSWKRLRAGP